MKPGPKPKFWAHVNFDGPVVRPELGKCWLWTAAKESDGRGAAWRDGKKIGAPRYAYEERNGRTDLWILHHCDVPACVRPEHLYAGTHGHNERDKDARGRRPSGLICGDNMRSKTHCPAGHPYDAANTGFKKPTERQKFGRRCKACARAYYHRRKQEIGEA